MMPDKIYIREYPDGVARFWEEKKKDDVVATIPHEYIRKDALLEWLEDMRFMANSERAGAYQKVIDKLNEM